MKKKAERPPDRRVIRYMEWAKLHSSARYNLARSGVEPWPMKKLSVDFSSLEITGNNFYGYRPLLRSIAERYQVGTENVATATGASMANYLCCAVLLRPGDEVLVEKPVYEPLLAVPMLLGARIRRFHRRFERSYELELSKIAELLNPRTRLIIVSNLHNPSGVRIEESVLRDLGRLAAGVGAWVLVDEVYLEACFRRVPRSAAHLGKNFVVTSSLTKVFGLDGLRCGWILASDRRLVDEAKRLNDFFGVNAAFPADQISAMVFPQLDAILTDRLALLRRNFALVRRTLTALSEALEWVEPHGGTTCFPRLKGQGSSLPLAEKLRHQYDTAIVPGHFFEAPRHFRLSFGARTSVVRRALDNLRNALRQR